MTYKLANTIFLSAMIERIETSTGKKFEGRDKEIMVDTLCSLSVLVHKEPMILGDLLINGYEIIKLSEMLKSRTEAVQ